jgi:hypothetical protein
LLIVKDILGEDYDQVEDNISSFLRGKEIYKGLCMDSRPPDRES